MAKNFILQLADKRDALNRQIPFAASARKKLQVSLILAAYLSFIVLFLQPFDTSQFEADYRTLLLSGYGILTFFVLVIHSSLENIPYFRAGKIWTVRHEIISSIFFFLFAGTVLYLYNRLIVNLTFCTWATYWRFLSITVLYMIPVFAPLMLFLRQKFGERIIAIGTPSTEVTPDLAPVTITGENKDEILRMDKADLLFVRAVENYVEICFVNDDRKVVSKTFRQTLSAIGGQAPFLEKCHRSYLVNIAAVKELAGNSQGATISFLAGGKEIPVSKTYYKQIKTLCSGFLDEFPHQPVGSSQKLVVSSNSAD